MNAHVVTEFNRRLDEQFRSKKSNGCCADESLFKDILKAFPDASLKLAVRNVTLNRVVRVLQINVPFLGECGRAYIEHADILVFFPLLGFWRPLRTKSIIQAQVFIEEGLVLAKLLKRELIIHHRCDLGRDAKKESMEYGPFKP